MSRASRELLGPSASDATCGRQVVPSCLRKAAPHVKRLPPLLSTVTHESTHTVCIHELQLSTQKTQTTNHATNASIHLTLTLSL